MPKAAATLLAALTLLAAALALAPAAAAQSAEGDPPTEFDTYWMVFLERGESPPQLDPEASAELQRRHLAHLGTMWRQGFALVAGPFEVPREEPLRGIVLFRGDLSRGRVEELAGADPAVEAGRLQVRAFKWYTGKGVLSFMPPPEE